MSNETKRDVFNDLVEELASAYIALDGEGIGEELTNEDKQAYLKDYDNALPDDMPVIPEAVGEWIRRCKGKAGINNILDALTLADLEAEDWIEDNSEVFALAWVLGVWKVEQTGEIVKAEEEK
ncbi:DUF1642 domain-containing protein [Lacticaseibacillus paracasei]|uniref:DUF1642 domain-containing protein n=1 Tax=Lacticaseibacillus paracasei TaxID=1597 RepID=UPI001C036C04|nr:DUF1642 domain-containing protein [Lacticaseibacillus paracasei]MBT9262343.1 DUF1642 domain-containing protein [Lacticaseibacillus paracasei]